MNKLILRQQAFYKLCLAGVIVLITTDTARSQAKLVIAGAAITLSNNAVLVIDNPDNTAITYTGAGYIQMQGAGDKVIWRIGAGNGNTYLLPFGNSTNYFPMQFNAASGTGAAGQLTLSTYATPTWKNSDFLPAGVPNVNRNGTDNSDKVIDRFWQINAAGYTTKPTLSNVVLAYTDQEIAAPNTFNESHLIPQRWNSTLLSWSDYFPAATINTAKNTVTMSTVPGSQLYEWWTLVDAGSALPVTLVAPASLFPNPAGSYINLSVNSSIAAWKPMAQLYDIRGSLLRSFTITGSNTLVNTASLLPGVYHIYFFYNEKPQTLTFIKK